MSTSLRDQLLKAGLVNKKQVSDAERQHQRQERRPPPKPARTSPAAPMPAARAAPSVAARQAQSAKLVRDQELNRQQQEKAAKKAHAAQIKQMIGQYRISTSDCTESYNFVDGTKIRSIPVNTAIRAQLGRGEIVIMGFEGRYDLVPVAMSKRILEREPAIFHCSGVAEQNSAVDDCYAAFTVPDDLIW